MRVRGLVSLAAGVVLAVTLTGCGGGAAGRPPRRRVPRTRPRPRRRCPTRRRTTSSRSGRTRPWPCRPGCGSRRSTWSRRRWSSSAGPADKSIALPTRPERAGWFKGGPRPGQPGPAVIIGHVDWDHGPAVFFRLREMKPGEAVYVDRADGSTQEFTVTAVRQVAKSDFPTDDVYAPDLQSSLRLITCGGQFDYRAHNYLDNVIVFASPA